MTWTKLGDEFPAEARHLTDAEFRTHAEALCWSNFRLLDLLIPKADVRRFAESPDADQAVKGLVSKGWWEDCGDHWNVGLRFPEWQEERVVVGQRREDAALRKRRSRLHKAGDHLLCLPQNCPHVTRDTTRDGTRDGTRRRGRDGSGPTVPPVPKSKTQDQGQVQGHPIANSHKPRVPDGPGDVADDAPLLGDDHAERLATDRNARTREDDTPFNPAA